MLKMDSQNVEHFLLINNRDKGVWIHTVKNTINVQPVLGMQGTAITQKRKREINDNLSYYLDHV